MKKLLLVIVSTTSIITMTTRSFGQGELGFFNAAGSAITLYDFNTGIRTRMFGSAGTYDIGLYMGSAGTTSIFHMQLVDLATSPNTASTSFNAGVFSGGTVTSPGNVANTLNFQAGTQYAFIVAGWASDGGSDYLTALSGDDYAGQSGLGFTTPVAAPMAVPNVFGTGAGQIGGFELTRNVPEPAAVAIGSLGAAALLLFRRRK